MSTTADTEITPAEKRRRDKYEARNKANAERIAANAARVAAAEDKARREGRGMEIPGCALCGHPDPESTFKEGRPGSAPRDFTPGTFGVSPGFRGRLCAPCHAAMERGSQTANLGGTDAHSGRYHEPTLADVIAATARLDSERPGLRPEDVVLSRRDLAVITWAGAVRAAWALDQDTPKQPTKPFQHLPSKWAKIEFPPEPEPPVHEPKPNPRRVVGLGCGICGAFVPESTRAAHARPPRAWGLPTEGGNVETQFCSSCLGLVNRGWTAEGVEIAVAAATTLQLLRRKHPVTGGLESGKYFHPRELRRQGLTLANFVIRLRGSGQPDPEPATADTPGFWFIGMRSAPTPGFPALAAALAKVRADQ